MLLLFSIGAIVIGGVYYWMTRESDEAEVEIEKGIVFIFEYQYSDWSKENHGFYIDNQRNVYLYHLFGEERGSSDAEFLENLYEVAQTKWIERIEEEEMQYYYKAFMKTDTQAEMIESDGETWDDPIWVYGVRGGTTEKLGGVVREKTKVLNDRYARTIYEWLMDFQKTIAWNQSPKALLKVEGELVVGDEDVEIEEGMAFAFQYYDSSGGLDNFGFYIDHQGKIFLYDLSDQYPGRLFEEYIENIYNVAEAEPVGEISQEELQYYYKMLMEMNDRASMAESSGFIIPEVSFILIYGVKEGSVEKLGELIDEKVKVRDDDYAKTIYKWLMDVEEMIPWNKWNIPLSKRWESEKGR